MTEEYVSNYYSSCGLFGWSRCARTRTSTRQKSYSCKCSVNGGWSSWSTKIIWRNDCSTKCGQGIETGYKTRTCTNPAPQYGGSSCSGSSTQTQQRSCKIKECPIDGGWTSFSKFTWNNDCSAACGVGVETGYRTRSCSNPTPAHGGKACSGAATEKATRSCKIKECPIDGQWSDYSTVSWNNDCSSTCGIGVETGTKTRTCTNPTPAYGGNTCNGDSSSLERRQCKTKECPIDGGWTDYSTVIWSGKCSATCDFGAESGLKTRTCTNPEPAFGGKTCVGESSATENRQCKVKECPIDGGWTDYSIVTWSGKCSTTCDFGTEAGVKTRTCTNPEPAFGGKPCVGESYASENRHCKVKECPIDGGWSEYSIITWSGKCSTTCDFGTESGVKTRTCTKPEPAFGGKPCAGESSATESRQCKVKECPIDGGWSEFSAITWSGECSTTCDFGTESGIKTRTCTSPTPAYGGNRCLGESSATESRQCKLRECPIDGGWSEYGPFTEWSTCSVTCGMGIQTKSHDRTCTNPEPQYGGKDCEGGITETVSKDCDMKKCPETICSDFGQGHTFTAHLQQCTKYLNCLNGEVTLMSCSDGTEWDNDLKTCAFPKEGSTCLATEPNDEGVSCQFHGQHLSHPTDCHKFYQCVGTTPKEMSCSNSLAWNDAIGNCDHPENVELCNVNNSDDGAADVVEDDTNESDVDVIEEFDCGGKTGFFADPKECTKYYWCIAGQKYHMPCGAGTYFEKGGCVAGTC
ncbi:unnamed protein product [Mytilus coruscus]|uniref:Chitin-binding type-2 domain-containing protein n=1 Tax=Mytilus coruscus TaxID=42192 RepID=A0A6J8CEK9_MYTCO|nr:unnamed protein product [Mytilus coruscus]